MDDYGCPFHETGVICNDHRRCHKCGWNPVEEKRRKEKLHTEGYHALEKKHVEMESDENAILFILENLQCFGGAMTQGECRAMLKLGERRFSLVRDKAMSRVQAMIREVML